MSLPDLTDTGDLPVGLHQASLNEVLARFATGSAQRISVGERLRRIYGIASATGHVLRFVVFGSFITDKIAPNDVDIFMMMSDCFDASCLSGDLALLFDHAAATAYFGASVFWIRRLAALGGEQATIEYWQAKRDGGKRGIIEIVGG